MNTDRSVTPPSEAAESSASDGKSRGDWLRLDLLGTETRVIAPKLHRPATTPDLLLPDFEMLGVLGRGGMGVVYRARQLSLNREVALKVLTHFGTPDPKVRARFQSEGELLARLQHPHIVPIFQAGVYDETPYLAMEYVSGGTLDELIHKELPTARHAAELMETVARAVQFAHERGVLHRDLKPGNILLTAEGQPKVADFGIARDLDANGSLTQTGEVVGTPAYLAPEQLQGEASLTPAVDVYALGVILHQLLTGVVPFVGDSLPMVLIQVLSRDALPLQTWQPTVPRDLDVICRKCLCKEAGQRYRAAGELADDLRRFLDGKPITARPEGSWGKARRWCRRHPTVACLSAALVGVTLIALAGLTWGLLAVSSLNRELELTNIGLTESNQALKDARDLAESRRQDAEIARTQAEADKKRAEQTVDFMVNAFRRPDPMRYGKSLTVSELLGTSWRKLATQESLDPLMRLSLMRAIARTNHGLGDDVEVVKVLESARRIAEASLSAEHPDVLAIRLELATAYKSVGRNQDAITLYEQVRDVQLKQVGPDDPATLDTLSNLAAAYQAAQRVPDALVLFEQVRDKRLAMLGPDHRTTLLLLHDLASAYWAAGRKEEAVQLFEQVHQRQAETLGVDHPNTLTTLNDLGVAYNGVGRAADAIPLHEKVRDVRLKKLGPDHPDTLITLHDLATAYRVAGRYKAAIDTFERVRDERMKKPGLESWETLQTLTSLGVTYRLAGRAADAVAMHEQVLEVRLRLVGPNHAHTLRTKSELAASYESADRIDDAIRLLEQVLKARLKNLGPDHANTISVFQRLVGIFEKLGRFDREEALLRDRHRHCLDKYGASSLIAATSGSNLGGCLLRQEKYADAETFLRQSLAIQEEHEPKGWSKFRTRALLGASLSGQKKYVDAETLLLEAYRGLRAHAEQIPAASQGLVVRQVIDALIELFQATGRTDEIECWQYEWELWAGPPAG